MNKRPKTDEVMQTTEDFRDESKALYNLSKKNFEMKTKEGKKLFYKYQIANYKDKLEAVDKEPTEKEKIQIKIDKRMEEIVQLEEQQKALG